MKQVEKFIFFCHLLVVSILFKTTEAFSVRASLSLFYFDTTSNKSVSEHCVCGLYGLNSPLLSAQGLVGIPVSDNLEACDANTRFTVTKPPWIALIERGNCSFAEKIQVATRRGAAAAVIYNKLGKGNSTVLMSHPGAESIVAIMIGNMKGMEILHRIESGMKVTMVIEVGKKHGPWMNQYSIFFTSVSFFIVTAATMGYFIFYSARRLRIARAQSRNQRQLKAKAKKAIEQLQLRTLKQGDKETGPDGDSCVVCIELYKPNEVVRILTCNHLFHKNCIDPWLLEHRTCPMCKCDILKVLGVEETVEEVESVQVTVSSEGSNVSSANEEDNRSETASSGYASVQGADGSVLEEHAPSENDNMHLVNNESQPPAVNALPHADNPSFEADEIQVREVRS
ncbi:E3 ubiquitin-protein ligase RNF128 isoform X2 [Pezoporus wallicus]|uniref:E3 ubiquitin-protein ligase RNF128 isoform X2 n=1 Tax=Pezoporus wallicus TaxID=35540 RepID=UPI00254CD50D|nr:E3 ubiquitin-protein ligase RNF128 isoform X2 [Pezoporus wallicus]XP_061302051.1 E3 ubiquitin-protein ligase RNF128 isoform X2 [Pezoporus flaviventris]